MKAPEKVLWGLVAGLLVFEAWALATKAPGDTISEVVWRRSKRPLLPFALGVLCGHFFWQSRD